MKDAQKIAAIGAAILVAYALYRLYRYMDEREFKYFSFAEFDSGATREQINDSNYETYFSAQHGNRRLTGSGMENMNPGFIRTLDKIRDEVGFPLVVTSGYRTPEWNAHVGGVQGSSHTKGVAVDFAAPTEAMRNAITDAAVKHGIKRIGYGAHKNFIHLDIDPDKTQYTIWNYGTGKGPSAGELWPGIA